MTDGWVSFERPGAFLLLLGLPVLAALYAFLVYARRRALTRFAGPSSGLVSASLPWQLARYALRLAGLAVLIAAIAGPQLGHSVERRDIVVLLDVSQSMATQDVGSSRLGRAREVIDRVATDLREQRIGLVYYAGDARSRFPATLDTPVIGRVLDFPGYPFTPATGSSLDAGLRAAIDLFPPEVRGTAAPKSLVLISDGENSRTVALTGALASQGIRVFAVGIGTEEGGEVPLYTPEGRYLRNLTAGTTPVVSTLDPDGLEALAHATGGRYWTYTGQELVPYEVSAEILKLPPTEVLGERWVLDDQRRWMWLAIALAILFLEACLPERRRMPAPAVG